MQSRSLLPLALAALCMTWTAPAAGAERFIEIDAEINGTKGVKGIGEATAVVVAPDGRHVYAVSHLPPGGLAVFERNVASGVLRFIESHEDDPVGPALRFSLSVDISPDGKHVYVAAYGSDMISIFARDATNGRLTFLENVPSPSWPYSLYKVWSVRVSPDGANVYAAVHGNDQIVVFSRVATTGTLFFVQALKEGELGISGLEGPTAVLVTPDGSHVYAISDESDSVVLFDRSPITGGLTLVDIVATPKAPHSIQLSPDGHHVYILGSGSSAADQLLAIYERDPVGGVLSQTGTEASGVSGATIMALDGALALDPSGTTLMLTRPRDAKISRFTRDPVSGSLSLIEELEGLSAVLPGAHTIGGPVNGRFDPAGATYYSASQYRDAVTAFRFATVECSTTPLACREPQKAGGSSLSIRDRDPDKRDKLKWKWGKGNAATDIAAFGDPVNTPTDYALCLYEGTTLSNEYLAAAAAECKAKPCWKATGSGFKFSHGATMPDGLQKMKLKAGAAGAGSVKISGKGALLDLPALPLTAPATIQLQAANGECWGATFSGPSANEPGKYKAKSD